MGHLNTPLPPEIDFDETVTRADIYRKYHSLFVDELQRRLSDEEFEAVREKANQCERVLKRLGDAIGSRHGAYLQYGVDKDFYEGKAFKKMVLAGLLAIASISFFTNKQYVLYADLGIVAFWAYRHHIAAQELGKSERALADRKREFKSLKRDLEDICPVYQVDRIKTEDFIILYLLSGEENIEHEGMVDQSLLPSCMRKTESDAQTIIDHFGANFERYDDPRVPQNMRHILWYKLLIANAPLDLREEIQEKFEQDYGYRCSPQWDYPEFLMSFNASGRRTILK